MLLYNFCVAVYARLIALASLWNPKAKLWTTGRKNVFERMARAISPSDRIVWIHVASLGEFEQGRPLMEQIRKQYPEFKILLTFFSPSGYEVRKDYKGADYIFYMPIDTPRNVGRFLDIAHPEIAVFVKYEFWLNYLRQLKARGTRTYVISSIFRRNSIFFRSYGFLWRQALDAFDRIFVQNEESRELLHGIGFDNVIVAGDTRFDRVAAIAEAVKRIDAIETFKGDAPLFIAGSTWRPDEEILMELIDDNPRIKFVIAPHEMDEARINRIMTQTCGRAVRYTHCDAQSLARSQVLILDTVGILASVYRYASWAYIGGGFGVGIHNTLEAATFALPIAFGPNYAKFKEARDMVALGAATKVESAEELKRWFAPLRDDSVLRAKVSSTAKDYTVKNQGATSLIMRVAFDD
ncbi:3-deoxy-D-manno-octulosonic acid transferase [Alistipes sp. Z76]|nr:3-deoxy-D-manno-octulosonic acid transferase [Alistipes sp. Z76]NCE67272.1 3-deoxy-D-manno-octulosonic acid transferase [Muribaculaceae bacterium M3]